MAAGLLNNNAGLAGLLSGAGQLGSAVLPYTMSQSEVENLRSLGTTFSSQAKTIAEQSAKQSAFQPFAVKTSTGANTQLNPLTLEDGSQIPQLTTTLGDTEKTIADSLFSSANKLAGYTPTTAQSLYDQIRAMQIPEEDRQRLALQTGLFNQGRSGVQTAAYGNTPEELAYQKAVQEAKSAAGFQAAQLAPQLVGQQIGNVTGLLSAAYTPQNQAMAGMQPALDMSRIAQLAAQGQSEALYKGGIAGLEAQAQASTAAANVEAARTQALATALSGMFAKPDYANSTSSGNDFFSSLLGYFNPPTSPAAAQTVDDITAQATGMSQYFGQKTSPPTP